MSTFTYTDWAGDGLDVTCTTNGGAELQIEDADMVELGPDDVKDLITKLAKNLNSASSSTETVDLDALLSEDRTTDRRTSWNRIAFESAAALDAGVNFRYAKGDSQASIEYRVLSEIFDVREIKGQVVVTGFDPDRDDVRAYRLDRIKGAVVVDI